MLASQGLMLANRVAPVISATIITTYALSGKRLSIVMGNEITIDQHQAIETHKQFRASPHQRHLSYFFGGG
jgi:hypothetical protein